MTNGESETQQGLFESIVLAIAVLLKYLIKCFLANKGDLTVLSKIIILRRGTGVNANRSDTCVSHLRFQCNWKKWQTILPNNSDADSTALTDGDKSFCKPFQIEESWLLKNIPVLPLRGYIHVAIVSSTDILFGPEVPQDMCTETPSLLMTQTSPTAGRGCDPFCDVPNTCIYDSGDEFEDSVSVIHHFFCNCISDSCNELLLMLRPESARGQMSVCETYVM